MSKSVASKASDLAPSVRQEQSDERIVQARRSTEQMKAQRDERVRSFLETGARPTFRTGPGGGILSARLHGQVEDKAAGEKPMMTAGSPPPPAQDEPQEGGLGGVIDGLLQTGRNTVQQVVEAGQQTIEDAAETGRQLVEDGQEAVAPYVDAGQQLVGEGRELVEQAVETGQQVVDEVVDSVIGDGQNLERETVRNPSSAHEDGALNGDDIADVNGDGVHDIEDVKAQIQANEAQEAAALEGLTETQREQYQRVSDAVQGDPRGELALQELLIDGKLTGGPQSTDGKGLLETLDGMTEQALADGIDRGDLISDVVQEANDPTVIGQGRRNTCGPTSASIFLAQRNPAEYARLVSGLATPTGQVQMANGDTIEREPGVLDMADGSNRSIPNRLLEPALMEYANPLLSYDDQRDQHQLFGHDVYTGLTPPEMDRVLQGLTGERFNVDLALPWNREELVDKIKDFTDRGIDVPVGVNWEGGDGYNGHYIEVNKIDDQFVYFTNPWGQEERMPIERFQANISAAHFQE